MSVQLGIDGQVDVGALPPDGCCPVSICNIDPEKLVCNFIGTLPSGPLWDEPKAAVMAGGIICLPEAEGAVCTSVVLHAAFTAQQLYSRLMLGLWPALRESNPFTAYDTLDEWLDRLGWHHCFKCACECVDDASELPPFQLLLANGQTLCCPDEAPLGLTNAVKKGIVAALWRLRLGTTLNLDAINFVISSLGAQVDCSVVDGVPSLTVCAVSDYLPAACKDECIRESCPDVQAYWELGCDGEGDGRKIYPGVLAAQCIVLAMIADRNIKLTRCTSGVLL